MMTLLQYAWLIPVMPLVAVLLIALGYAFGFNRGERGERFTSRVSLSAVFVSWLLSVAIAAHAFVNGVPGLTVFGEWLHSGDYHIMFSFSLDWLGISIGLLVVTIALLTLRFSVNYLHREDGFQRYFIIMNLFTAAMLLIVLAGSAAFMFIGWELAGMSSYLLIGYALDRENATHNANNAFITNRFGDVGFILALAGALFWSGGVDWHSLHKSANEIDSLYVYMILAGFIVAAMAKSAMVPFAPWITRALEGPTPSSAIFYGSLMVHAGVFLLLRLEPVLTAAPVMMNVLVVIGVLSVLYGFLGGLVQSDVKTAFMFSTTAQVGLMFIECGLGWFDLATYHLAAHAIWRSYQFLSAPSYMQLISRRARPIPAWLRNQQYLYNACVQRFWLENVANALITRPTHMMSGEVNTFDKKVINQMVGLPASANAISSLADWEQIKRSNQRNGYDKVGTGEGLLGKFMETIASQLHWFEEQLVLKGGGEGLLKVLQSMGNRLVRVERLLSKPRYLWLMILATLVVVL